MFEWYKDGILIVEGRAQFKDFGDGRYSLMILETNADDFGEYSVVVTYASGEIRSSATVRRAVIIFKKKICSRSISEGGILHMIMEVDGQPIKIEVELYYGVI